MYNTEKFDKMSLSEKHDYFMEITGKMRRNGMFKKWYELAELIDSSANAISGAKNKNENYLTSSLLVKLEDLMIQSSELPKSRLSEMKAQTNDSADPQETLPVLPTSARAGTLGDFADSIKESDCERMISPIKGADYALQITGESMTPEYPNGSTIIIKKVSGDFLEWGRCYCLDTMDGSVIKLIYPTDKEDQIECRSINPAFPPFRVKTDLIRGWYRVLMCLSLK